LTKGRAADAERPFAVIGKDTRISSDMLETALTAGLCAAGVDVLSLGVFPTPGVAYVTRLRGAVMGIVISASHNPYEHNGIKLFSTDGFKITDDAEREIEALIDSPDELKRLAATHERLGRVVAPPENDRFFGYVDYLAARAAPGLSGLSVLVDCACGAASETAPALFAHLDCRADIIHNSPDGVNINAGCGSTHLDQLKSRVISGGYSIGVAFDGDADRCLFVDETGGEINGDIVLAACARELKNAGRLPNNTVVGTVMTNSGFNEFAENEGITLLKSDVGDRHVLELMRSCGGILGGEASGHTIFLEDATTGDGELTAVKFLSCLAKSGKKASEFAKIIRQNPQIILNVEVPAAKKAELMENAELKAIIARETERIGTRGMVLVRPSGTESLIRVTVEAETREEAEGTARRIGDVVTALLGR
ncbi:MAG: phosphoglucosamine mutase, partial [Oscillospiraceae bacterium]|nr:phosphoglucosamine mutase [Oscillospiraceae bacterium]